MPAEWEGDGMAKPQRMTRDAWAALAAKGEAPDAILTKQYVAEIVRVTDDGEDEPMPQECDFVISTESVDRDHDTIALDGWKLANYRKNPVVLWAHDYRMPPIGRSKRIAVKDGALRARVEFAPAEAYPLAETVRRLVFGGFLKTASVGFRPMKHVFNSERGGVDFSEQELLEWSIVPVPSNPEALSDAKAAGIDVEPFVAWATDLLKSLAIEAPSSSVTKPRVLPPDDGKCPAGYSMGDDGMCHEKATLTGDDLRLIAVEIRKVGVVTAEQLGIFASRVTRLEATHAIAVEPDVLTLDADPPPDDALGLSDDEVRAAFAAALKDVVDAQVRGAIDALRGRVD